MTIPPSSDALLQSIERSDIRIVREMPSFFGYNEDFVFQHVVLTLILSSSARAKYDMRVITHHKNDLTIILPGHVMHPIDCTDDFSYIVFFYVICIIIKTFYIYILIFYTIIKS